MKSFFYKFMPINKHTIENLSKNQIWFSSPLKFNDPFDFLIPFDYTFSDRKFREKVSPISSHSKSQYEDMVRFYQNNPAELQKWSNIGLKRFVSKTRVACFCEEKTEILMWSHYADYHKGICLKFDSLLDRHFFYEEDWGNHKMIIRKVEYPKKFEKVNILDDALEYFEKQAFTKYFKWKYEKEHRIISAVNSVKFQRESLVEVNFGCNCLKKDKTKIIKIIKENNYPNVKFIEARKSKTDFALEFNEISEGA